MPPPAHAPSVQVIAEHLYREGRFDLADQFVAEAGVSDAAHLKAPYTALHTVLEQVRTPRAALHLQSFKFAQHLMTNV